MNCGQKSCKNGDTHFVTYEVVHLINVGVPF